MVHIETPFPVCQTRNGHGFPDTDVLRYPCAFPARDRVYSSKSFFLYLFAERAASSIKAATSFGWEMYTT